MLAFMQRPEMLARDFTYPLRGALALIEGLDPYEVIRPSGPPPYDWPFMYPLTAALVAVPFALLPMQLAGVLFVMCQRRRLRVRHVQGWTRSLLGTAQRAVLPVGGAGAVGTAAHRRA